MMTHMLKLAKKQSFPEDFPKSRKFWGISRNDWILKFQVQNQVPWQKVSGKNAQYIEISESAKSRTVWDFGILRSKKFRRSPKVPKINPYMLQGSFLQKTIKKQPFCYSSFFTPLLNIEITLEGGVENKQTNF